MNENKEHQKKLTNKQRAFVDCYLVHFNATQAALESGYSERTAYSIGQENLKKPEILACIKARLQEHHMSADEALGILAEQVRADISVFFKVVEEWTFSPLPTHEIIKSEYVVMNEGAEREDWIERFLVRRVVIDVDKLVNPKYSHLLREFSDSPKNGISIKLHDKQSAIDKILRVAGKYNDSVDLTSGGEKLTIEIVRASDENARSDK